MTPDRPQDGHPDARPEEIASPHAAAFHFGAGHVVMYANPAFVEAFGRGCLGMPAREVMVGLPAAAFVVMDRVLQEGRPLARRIRMGDVERRLVAVPRVDPETREVYGVTSHLVPLDWKPVRRPAGEAPPG